MVLNNLATLAVAALITGLSSVALRPVAHLDLLGRRDIQVTLKRGHSYTIPLPQTAYPGAPFRVDIAEPGYNSPSPFWGTLMANTISYSSGSISWNNDRLGSGQAFPGQTVTVDLLGNLGTQDALLQAVPVGSSEEGLQLSATSNSSYPSQTFIIRISN